MSQLNEFPVIDPDNVDITLVSVHACNLNLPCMPLILVRLPTVGPYEDYLRLSINLRHIYA